MPIIEHLHSAVDHYTYIHPLLTFNQRDFPKTILNNLKLSVNLWLKGYRSKLQFSSVVYVMSFHSMSKGRGRSRGRWHGVPTPPPP